MNSKDKAKLLHFDTWCGRKILCNDAKRERDRCAPGTAMYAMADKKYKRFLSECERLDLITSRSNLRPCEERAFRLRYECGKSVRGVTAAMQISTVGDETYSERTVLRYINAAIEKIWANIGVDTKKAIDDDKRKD